jgi:hypothetical protein
MPLGGGHTQIDGTPRPPHDNWPAESRSGRLLRASSNQPSAATALEQDAARSVARTRHRTGSVTVKVVPADAVEVTAIPPPCARATSWAMYRPSPVLPLRGPQFAPRTKGSKICGKSTSGIGGPSLWTLSRTCAPSVVAETTISEVWSPCCTALETKRRNG